MIPSTGRLGFLLILALLCSFIRRRPHCFVLDTAIVHTTTPKTIAENGAIRKQSPEWRDLKTMLFKNAVFWCGRRKRCYLKTVASSKRSQPDARTLDREYLKWRTDATVWLQFCANFAGRYIEMRMRRVQLSMRTEGITAFSKRIRRCSVDGRKRYENDKCGRKSF